MTAQESIRQRLGEDHAQPDKSFSRADELTALLSAGPCALPDDEPAHTLSASGEVMANGGCIDPGQFIYAHRDASEAPPSV